MEKESEENKKENDPNSISIMHFKSLLEIEDAFKCSGMCREALFFYARNINKDGLPKETCLHHVKKYMMENAVPYTMCCVLLSICAGWIFLITLCMFQRGGDNQ